MNGLTLRKATLADIARLQQLIQSFVARGVMLPRNELELAEHIRDFTVALDVDGTLLGAGALQIYTPTMAEVRSLAVNTATQGRGVGKRVIDSLICDAEDLGLESIFAFTYVTGFFEKVGFREVPRSELPLKVWKDCLRCPKFQSCDEIAVIRRLREPSAIPPKEAWEDEPVAIPRLSSEMRDGNLIRIPPFGG